MEKDTNKYFDEQLESLKLQIRAANTKADQMSKLADARQREVMEMKRRGYEPSGSPYKTGKSPMRGELT